MNDNYILEGHEAKLVDMMTWARWFEDADADERRVAFYEDGGIRVSTVFIGLNHEWRPDAPPQIFETMVFGGPLDDEQQRYATWEQAEDGHKALVLRVKEAEGEG